MTAIRLASRKYVPIVTIQGRNPFASAAANEPALDDRAPATQMIVLGALPGKRLRFDVVRNFVDPSVELSLSATGSAFSIVSPRGRTLSGSRTSVTILTGDSEGHGDFEVRVGETLVSTMRVKVWAPKRVRVSTWLVRLDSSTATGTAPTAPDVTELFRAVNAIWSMAGIVFEPTHHEEVLHATVATVDRMNHRASEASDEVDAVLGTASTPNALNIYFVRGFSRADDPTLGVTYDLALTGPRPWSRGGSSGTFPAYTSRTGMILRTDGTSAETLHATVAHEIGHFLSLQHPHTPEVHEDGSRGHSYDAGAQFLMNWQQPAGTILPLKRVGGGVFDENGADEARAYVDAHALGIS